MITRAAFLYSAGDADVGVDFWRPFSPYLNCVLTTRRLDRKGRHPSDDTVLQISLTGNVTAEPDTGNVASNPTHGMNVFCAFVLCFCCPL